MSVQINTDNTITFQQSTEIVKHFMKPSNAFKLNQPNPRGVLFLELDLLPGFVSFIVGLFYELEMGIFFGELRTHYILQDVDKNLRDGSPHCNCSLLYGATQGGSGNPTGHNVDDQQFCMTRTFGKLCKCLMIVLVMEALVVCFRCLVNNM